jgi:hypothetical protein
MEGQRTSKKATVSSQFRIYVVRTPYYEEPPFVITTVRGGPLADAVAEYFLVIPDVPGVSLRGHYARLNITGLLGLDTGQADSESDESVVLGFAAKLGGRAMQAPAYDRYMETRLPGESFQAPTLIIVPDAGRKDELKACWLRGNCTEDLRWIAANTQCAPLQELLHDLETYPPAP